MKTQTRLGRPWSANDVKTMRSAAKRGLSARQVARTLRRSRGSVAFKAMTLGISFHAINMPAGVQRRRFRKPAAA